MGDVADIFIEWLARIRKVYSNVPGWIVMKLHLTASNTLSASDIYRLLRVLMPGQVIHTSRSSGLGVLETA